jgi:hypothetical protein
MAIMDKYLEFCDAEALSTAVIASATTTMGNVIELAKAKNPSSGRGTPVFLHLKVSTVFGSGGSATIGFDLEHAGTNTPASFSKVAGILPSTTAVATYAAGYEYITTLPSLTMKRFIRLKYAVGVTRLTGGAIDAWLDLSDAAR